MRRPQTLQRQLLRLATAGVLFTAWISHASSAEPAPIRGMVGVGTFATQAEFKDIKVTQGDRTLYASDFSNGLQDWKLVGGTWEASDGVLRQTSDEEYARALIGELNWTDYTLTLKARKLGGKEGFMIYFGVSAPWSKSCWNLGGWNNTAAAFQAPFIEERKVPGNVETGVWYDVKIEVKDNNVRGYLNNKPIQRARREANKFTVVPPARMVQFSTEDPGQQMPLTRWGIDTAWESPDNVRRSIEYIGKENVDLVRVAFMFDDPIVDGDLSADAKSQVEMRLRLAQMAGDPALAMVGRGGKGVSPSLKEGKQVIPERWAEVIAAARRHYGEKVESVEPFNEPDFDLQQGNAQNLFDVLGALQQSPDFAGIKLSGPSTLNCDEFAPWYKVIKSRVDVATTHALAGSMENYINFLKIAVADGKATQNPEAHNLVEVVGGAEYGLQSAIWWGVAEVARGEFAKASKGVRLAYAEDRPRWTCAAVYRTPAGKVQAFVGGSERMAATTIYKFVATDRDVFFDGYGPQREFTLTVPGGDGYHEGQLGAEKVVNITWGEDVQPPVGGRYVIVNRHSGKVLTVAGASKENGADIQQTDFQQATNQVWHVAPLVGTGDLSYFTVRNLDSRKALDTAGHNYDQGGRIQQWGKGEDAAQQWYFEYAGDYYFYIRSRWSNKCLGIASASNDAGASVQQFTHKDDDPSLQWRLVPVSILGRSPLDSIPPQCPTELTAAANSGAIELQWTASSHADVFGYNVFRSTTAEGPYDTIARGVETNTFTDKKLSGQGRYFYKVKAMDRSLNQSVFSTEADSTRSLGSARAE